MDKQKYLVVQGGLQIGEKAWNSIIQYVKII